MFMRYDSVVSYHKGITQSNSLAICIGHRLLSTSPLSMTEITARAVIHQGQKPTHCGQSQKLMDK